MPIFGGSGHTFTTALVLTFTATSGASAQRAPEEMTAPGDPGSPGVVWRYRGESRVDATQWRAPARRATQDRAVVRHRLTLGIFNFIEGEPRRVHFEADLEVGADLAPPDDTLDAQPHTDRTTLDLRHAYLRLEDLPGPVSLTAGRHQLYDPAGFDAVDGATLTLTLPGVQVSGTGGWVAHRETWGFGPDVPAPQGSRPSSGHLWGLSVSSRVPGWLDARAAWRQRLDGEGDLTRSLAGAALRLTPLAALWVRGDASWDLIFDQLAEASAGVGVPLGPFTHVELGARRRRPVYDANSIWAAFDPQPHDAGFLSAQLGGARWRLLGRVDARRYHEASSGDGAEEAIGGELDGSLLFGPPEARAHLGLRGAMTEGYGGAQGGADVYGQLPLSFERGEEPLWLRGRLGVVYTEGADALAADTPWSGASGWALLALRWPASETSLLELLAESHHSAFTPARLRVMARLVLEEWL